MVALTLRLLVIPMALIAAQTPRQVDLNVRLQPSADARVVLTVSQPSFVLGENVLVHYCVENSGRAPFGIELGGDSRGASRSHRFKITVSDPGGRTMPDPDPEGFHLGGLGIRPEIPPGERACQSLPLFRYARIDAPGTYDVRVTHDLGWPAGTAPEGRIAITLQMPTPAQAEAVVASALASGQDSMGVLGRLTPTPWPDFMVMRQPVYLEPLVQRADAGETRVMPGIGNIATPEATRALIRLLESPHGGVAADARRWLAMRLPDPALTGDLPGRGPFNNQMTAQRRYLSTVAWRADLAPDVRAVATRLLSAPPDDVDAIVAGAFMLQAVGVVDDVPVFSAALSRAIIRTTTLPMETGGYPRPRGAMRELMRTADVLVARGYRVADPRRTPGETALWLVALGRGQRADGWENELAWALEHPVPYIREVALERLPAPAAERFVPMIRRSLEQPDVDVAIAACKIVERDRIRSLRPQLSELLSRAQDTWLINAIGNALYVTGGRFEYLDAMARRMADPSQAVERFHSLITVFDSKGASGAVTPQEAAATSERWRTFLAARHQEIEAGQRIPLDVRVPLDLIPPGWKFTRPDGTSWPPGR